MSAPQHHFKPIDFKARFPALDGIRALAILMVFAAHYGGGTHGGPLLHFMNRAHNYGWIGVDLFFALSGFLITGILYDTRTDSKYFKRFFARRSVRVFPIFYLVFLVLLLLTPLFHFQWKPGHFFFLLYMGNLSMISNPSLEILRSSWNPLADVHIVHFWSLCVEEQFYLLWPLIIWFVRDRIRIIRIAAALSVLAFVLRVIMVMNIDPSKTEHWIMHLLPFRMDTLLIGGILALLLRGENADLWQRRCKWLFLLPLIPVIAMCAVSSEVYSTWLITIGLSFIALFSTGLLGISLRHGSAAYRFFHLRPLRLLGKYSYGFYIYHELWPGPYFVLVRFLASRLHSSILANGISDVFIFALYLLMAKLSYDLFEVRFLRFKKHFEYDSELQEHRTNFAEELNA
ncbi:MAG TPA: acyltransferase [Edaphobacter sp.]